MMASILGVMPSEVGMQGQKQHCVSMTSTAKIHLPAEILLAPMLVQIILNVMR
jgi:hypothetical protein